MRILHVVPSYLPAVRYGGTIVSVHGLCRALAALGHEVDVLTTSVDGPGDAAVPLGRPVPLDGVRVHYFRSPCLRRLYWSPSLRRALPGRVAAAQVVHLHSIYLWPTAAGAREARRQGAPYVLSPRGMLEKGLVARRSRWVKSAWLALVERRNLEGAAALHFTSERERREAGRFGYRFAREAVIPNGVEAPAGAAGAAGAAGEGSAAVRSQLRDPSPYVLYLGRISWKKGLDRLVRAMTHVQGARLIVAGNDEEGYWPRIGRLAGELGLAERVAAVGPVGEADKRLLLEGAAALALASYSENFGNVVLEALAAGCPAVVTPEVGAAEIVEREQAGLVVDGDPGALGPALAALLRDEPRRAGMSARGRAAAARLSWAAVAGRMAELYRSLPGAAGPR